MSTSLNLIGVQNTFMARQPIFGSNSEVIAYELLYRKGHDDEAIFQDEDAATAKVMLNTFLEFGLKQVVGQSRAFINVTRSFILEKFCEALPNKRVVLEVLENVAPDPEVIRALTELSNQGYTISLDDFVYSEAFQPMVEIADIVKIDVLNLPRSAVEEHVKLLRQYRVKLLAEKVETQEDLEFCKDLGFDYFQGYFFCKPKILAGKSIPSNRMSILILLSKLQCPEIQIPKLAELIRDDVALTYKILRYVNSAFIGLPTKVDSISQAACLVGTEQLRIWAILISLSSIEEKPLELMTTAVIRGKMCEQLAMKMQQGSTDRFFMVGLFSVLDALFDCEMEDVLTKLPLLPEINEALLSGKGILGRVLQNVIAYEKGNWEEVSSGDLELSAIQEAYVNAIDSGGKLIESFRS